ncbi:MAG: virulence factor [Neomegalonema sp.]|nr:virulence factor [Neomegalonema sp.]
MPRISVKLWRDIPAMVMVGRGRTAGKAPLPERFEQAIDRCAMKVGAKDDDAYLNDWRSEDRGEATLNDGVDAQSVAERISAELEAAYDQDKIKQLIANNGWDAAARKE